jgi:uncharacterized protein YbjT (DUF2867 family)
LSETPASQLPPIVITGAAGLVGQNLIVRLKQRGHGRIIAIDKHPVNTSALARLHPDILTVEADLSVPGVWESHFPQGGILIQSHAQIGGPDLAPFEANNIRATEHVLRAATNAGMAYLIHISSSVVNSTADDFYTRTKLAQERLVNASRLPHIVLRPTLMFGWFDRKHLGWLARFMRRVPLFPIPGSGKYRRQPLFVGDFCNIITACVEHRPVDQTHNISGREVIDYIDLIKAVRTACGARAVILPIPFSLFRGLLAFYGLFDRNPPFTTRQLAALIIPELFEIIDWPAIFGVPATRLEDALRETFQSQPYASIELAF